MNTLQHTATHCNTLQHTATHCNTLQHTATQVLTTYADAKARDAQTLPLEPLGLKDADIEDDGHDDV